MIPILSNVSCESDNADYDYSYFEQIANSLEQTGFVVVEGGLPKTLQADLLSRVSGLADHEFARAGVGRGDELQIKGAVRRDQISWVDEIGSDMNLWLRWTDELRKYLNGRLFLGLFSFESHFAKYLPGDFYQTHVDAFHGACNRILSLVTYLNDPWQDGWGGELVLYDEKSGLEITRVVPKLGTLVLFLSEEFPHEVLPATHVRHSLTGWFRVNTSLPNKVDPPV